MFTSFNEKLPHRRIYIRKQLRYVFVALLFIGVSLAIGTAVVWDLRI